MPDRKQHNSTLRPHSPKRMKQMQAGTWKPKPRTPLKAKARTESLPDGTFPMRKRPDPVLIDKLKKVIKLQEGKQYGSTLNYKGGSARAKLDDELMTLYSRYRRRAACELDDRYRCFICGRELAWNDEDAVLMHFQGRICLPTRFHDIATQPGCSDCNNKPNGDRPNFARRLDAVYGPGTADAMTIESKRADVKYDRQWYRDKIEFYKGELRKFGL